MLFSGVVMNTKGVDNLLMQLLLKFGGHWPYSLGDMAVLNQDQKSAIHTFSWTDSGTL